jgi:hypothetical protein
MYSSVSFAFSPTLLLHIARGFAGNLQLACIAQNLTFCSDMVAVLPGLLQGVIPSDDLICLLRNTHFQGTIFSLDRGYWPEVFISQRTSSNGISSFTQKDSLYPMDLTQLWDDHNWITDLVLPLWRPQFCERISPSFRFDSIYAEILSHHPDALLLARVLMLYGHMLQKILFPVFALLDVLNPSFSTLKPFLVLRTVGYCNREDGDSLANFLLDARRAKGLYACREEIIEQWMLHWVDFAKQSFHRDMLGPLRSGKIFQEICY